MTQFTRLACEHLDTVISAGEIRHHDTQQAIYHVLRLIQSKDKELEQLRAKLSTLFEAIKHGDEKHQLWLKDAIEKHIRGEKI